MKNTVTIQVRDIYTAFCLTYLKESCALDDKMLFIVSVIFKHWNENQDITDDWKNAVCEDIGYTTKNKWALLNRALKELTNTHVRLKATIGGEEIIESCPIVRPTKYLSSIKKRQLLLHPILEAGLKVLKKQKEVELTIKYKW